MEKHSKSRFHKVDPNLKGDLDIIFLEGTKNFGGGEGGEGAVTANNTMITF